MRLKGQHPDHGLLVAMVCKCSVWPIMINGRVGRCGDCGVVPKPIPKWEDIPERDK